MLLSKSTVTKLGEADNHRQPRSVRRSLMMLTVMALAFVALLRLHAVLSALLFQTEPPALSARSGDAGSPNLLWTPTDIDSWNYETQGTDCGYVWSQGAELMARCTEADGTNWHFLLHQDRIPLMEGRSYTLQFSARADRPCPITAEALVNTGNWHHVGLNQTANLTRNWRTYRYSFRAKNVVPGHVRVPAFSLGGKVATIWLADISLREQK